MRRLPLLLALILALTGFGQAIAAGRMAGASEVTLCTAAGSIVLVIDSGGQPVAGGHDCLDCLLPVLAEAPPVPGAARPPARATALAVPAQPVLHVATPPRAVARGPPILV